MRIWCGTVDGKIWERGVANGLGTEKEKGKGASKENKGRDQKRRRRKRQDGCGYS